jgi:GTP-binding protein
MALINYQTATFAAAYGAAKQLPEPVQPEVAFVGRSNVGKSSLLNKLLNRKSLAKVSSKPGKTQTINFYDVDGIYLVDLPGYGYAQVGRSHKERWASLIDGYFESERSHNLVVSLVDIRHDPTALDRDMIAYIKEAEFPFVVALTKADKLSRAQQQKQLAAIARQLDVEKDDCIVTSSETGLGMDELKARIADACL